MQVNAAVNLEGLVGLRSMVEQGKLKIPIDSCWDMKDALQVRAAIDVLFVTLWLTWK